MGSISTTLDPSWKGMLMFSLNNPTKKVIKIVLDIRENGVIHKQAVSTLILWKNGKAENEEDHSDDISLHLDNPPMRIDIWSELTEKPVRFWKNREYQEFCRLVRELSNVELKHSERVAWVPQVTALLDELQIALKAKNTDEGEAKIQEVLVRLKRFKEIPVEMRKCLDKVTEKLDSEQLWNDCQNEEYRNRIQRADREVEYQLLCDQVEQIHEIISKRKPVKWRYNFPAYLWLWIRQNFMVLIALFGVVIAAIRTSEITSGQSVIFAAIPTFVSIINDFYNKNEQKI